MAHVTSCSALGIDMMHYALADATLYPNVKCKVFSRDFVALCFLWIKLVHIFPRRYSHSWASKAWRRNLGLGRTVRCS